MYDLAPYLIGVEPGSVYNAAFIAFTILDLPLLEGPTKTVSPGSKSKTACFII